jgi:hypothetical protein
LFAQIRSGQRQLYGSSNQYIFTRGRICVLILVYWFDIH